MQRRDRDGVQDARAARRSRAAFDSPCMTAAAHAPRRSPRAAWAGAGAATISKNQLFLAD
jgi:hypothetical protein